jgi:antitoxin component YwqK of YwqJK toxin-antitoxin module
MRKSLFILIPVLFCFLFKTSFGQGGEEWNQKDEKGQKVGKWRAYYSNGNLRYEGQFREGQPFSIFKYYFQDGKLKTVLRHRSATEAYAEHYYQTGDLMATGKYTNQKKDSVWTSFGAGNVKVEQGGYIAGKKYGIWRTFYPNGQVAEEVTIVNDLENGPYKSYFIDGTLKQEGTYENGLLEGLSEFYDANGNKILKGKYYRGSRDGRWIYYKELLKVDKVLEYDKGQLLNPEALDTLENDSEEYRNNIKDYLEFEDLKGKIKYE